MNLHGIKVDETASGVVSRDEFSLGTFKGVGELDPVNGDLGETI